MPVGLSPPIKRIALGFALGLAVGLASSVALTTPLRSPLVDWPPIADTLPAYDDITGWIA